MVSCQYAREPPHHAEANRGHDHYCSRPTSQSSESRHFVEHHSTIRPPAINFRVGRLFSCSWRSRSDMATIWPSGSAGSAERSFGGPVKIQGERQRVLEPLHYPCGKPANLAFKAHGWQRSQSLNIGCRFTIKEGKLRQRHFIRTASPLGGKRHVQDEGPRRVRVLSGDDDDGPRLGSESQVRQPDLTGF